jgi:hypothetical protein
MFKLDYFFKLNMTCPWLVRTEEGYECSAVSPPTEIDFDKPSPPDVNGDICKLPEPNIPTNPPWGVCKRYRPVGADEDASNIAKGLQNIDRRIIYASIIIIIIIGIAMNLPFGQIYSSLAILLIGLIILANIGYLYTRSK